MEYGEAGAVEEGRAELRIFGHGVKGLVDTGCIKVLRQELVDGDVIRRLSEAHALPKWEYPEGQQYPGEEYHSTRQASK
jgi:hypothetical protein